MVRAILVLSLALVTTSMVSALTAVFGTSYLAFLPAILLVAYIGIADTGPEGMILAALLGLLMDAWSGTLLGVNMLICLFLYFVGAPLARISGAPQGLPAFMVGSLFVVAYGFIYNGLFALFRRGPQNIEFVDILVSGLLNGMLALMFFPFIHFLFVYFGFPAEREFREIRRSHAHHPWSLLTDWKLGQSKRSGQIY